MSPQDALPRLPMRSRPHPAPTRTTTRAPPDPEAQRIQNELSRLRDDAGARSTFYDELRRTVEHVRAGTPDEDTKAPASSGPAWRHFQNAPSEPHNPPAKNEGPQAFLDTNRGSLVGAGLVPALSADSQASMDTHRGSLDGAAYWRVVHYAKANGAPVPLALGVAWIESRLQTYPPRGAAGEVGMFQILPARCRLEGWPPQRLKEPEFNAWLGTLLLARYYQEEGSWARAAAKYVAGPGVFDRSYSHEMWAYINWYASSVDNYAGYFSRYQG